MKKLIDAKELAFKLAFNFQPDENEFVEGYNKAIQDVMMLIAEMSMSAEEPKQILAPVQNLPTEREQAVELIKRSAETIIKDTEATAIADQILEKKSILNAVKLYKNAAGVGLRDAKNAVQKVRFDLGHISGKEYYNSIDC